MLEIFDAVVGIPHCVLIHIDRCGYHVGELGESEEIEDVLTVRNQILQLEVRSHPYVVSTFDVVLGVVWLYSNDIVTIT